MLSFQTKHFHVMNKDTCTATSQCRAIPVFIDSKQTLVTVSYSYDI